MPDPPALGGKEGGARVPFVTRVSPADAMAQHGRLPHYFAVGLEALRLIERALELAGAPDPRAILDLPSGYGRVLRMLRWRFPRAQVVACDIDADAIRFCAERLGARPLRSAESLADLELRQRFDLVWCGSLVTHLPATEAAAAIDALARHTAPDGVLVFTAHGSRIAELLRAGSLAPALEPRAVARMLAEFERGGFGFATYAADPDRAYGFSLASREWVEGRIASLRGFETLAVTEAGWDGKQDVYALRRS